MKKTRDFSHYTPASVLYTAASLLLLVMLTACSPSGVSQASTEAEESLQADGTKEARGSKIADSVFENRVLIVDGTIYYGTSETGPMGDSDAVDGYIQSSLEPDVIPYEEGQSNFGCVGNPYTWDTGDGSIMVLSEDDEWHIFERRIEAKPSGSYCAFIKRIDEDKLYVDMAERITPEDTERIGELGLTESDMAGGYYIHNPSRSQIVLQLTDDTVYHLASPGRELDSTSEIPFFIQTENGIVTEITEEPPLIPQQRQNIE